MQKNVPYPQHLLIETTTRCNLRCKQCAHVEHKYALADMKMEIFFRLHSLFPHLKQVALYGHGETFLHKNFFDMLGELKQRGIFVYVTTNGTLLTQDVAERLVALQLDRLSFSLDAATPDLFNEIRRGADFEKLLQNIRNLNDVKKRAHRDDKPVLSIMYCAMRSNIQELPKLVELADELNMLHGISVINIVEHGKEAEGQGLTRYPELAKRYLSEARELAVKRAVPFEVPGTFSEYIQPVTLSIRERIYRNYREFHRSFNRAALFRLKLLRIWDRILHRVSPHANKAQPAQSSSSLSVSAGTIRVRDCRDPWEFLFVNVHGEVRVCCASHRIMGNINEQNVLDIWNNEDYQAFRARILSSDPPEECQICPMRGWKNISTHSQAEEMASAER